jgi:hypothetical protein
MWPRRRVTSPITSPKNCSGVRISTRMMGSRMIGLARRTASRTVIAAAVLNASSDESTGW